MTKQILEHPIEVTKLVCDELSKATEQAVQARGSEYGLKIHTFEKNRRPIIHPGIAHPSICHIAETRRFN